MTTKRGLRRALAITVLVLACSDPTGTAQKIETVDGLLARICELAAQCAGISATAADVAACPAGTRAKLSQNQLQELGGFTSYTKAQQDTVLQCIGMAICGRFGGGLSSMSDSDLMEPYRACVRSV